MILNRRIRLFTFLIISAMAPAAGEIPAFFSLDTTGCGALMEGNYRQALAALWTQRSIADSGYWNFKKGVAHFATNDLNNAMACFSYAGRKDSLFRAVSNEYMGDIAGMQKKTREAVESYLRAQRDSLNPDYSLAIRSKITALVNADPLLIDTIPFLNAWWTDTARFQKERRIDPYASLDSLSSATSRARIDSVLALLTDTVENDDAPILLSRLDSLRVPDSSLSTIRLFRISQIALQAKAPERALAWLSKASARPDFTGAIPGKTLLHHRAFVQYGCSHYDTAIDLLEQYKTKFGPIPDVLFAIARSYHRLNQEASSLKTYELFTRLFPKDTRIANVYWYLAWENDQKQNFQKAISLYRRIADIRKKPVRAADALFRIGLCQYKEQQYVKACSTFARVWSLYPDAPCALASQYWRSQCYLSREEYNKAKSQFVAIIRISPTDYYAYRAREALALLGDTASVHAIDTIGEYSSTRQWFDSLSKDTLSPIDSCRFELGKKLAFSGCSRIARFYFEPLEAYYPGNLRFQFDLGVVYNLMSDPVSSLRIGRRLLGRISNKCRDAMPLQVYSLIYPFAFFKDIKQRAALDTVDPFLILGIIRQESVYNPLAVSHAGAIGLMQLMPSTARTIATELGEHFSAESLARPEMNIRFGVYYVKKLLGQFKGNIVQAIAAYNGGPPAITRWFEQNKKKTFDLFIEDIGYDETRGYVKKVLANFWTYRILSRMLNIS